ncbi:methyl-accepting chemotaxis protein [Stappia stellulata]|uniref:methyl-accepting chemotaxis protein n=1 Tax=Stappia stellulata TaxID=71235 RepID=UPI001CD645B0|nr:methyl-accepting chemotaxis protein [Stappia stellulata]MCA1244874.1 methyl-accepting chemotaxis protein [Stappia stellulata]
MNLKIGHRLGALVLLFALGIAALLAVQVSGYHTRLVEDRKAELTHIVEAATSMVAHEYALAQSGAKTEEQAKRDASEMLRALRYGGNEYFWINDMQHVMLMHPFSAKLEGKNLETLEDKDGTRFFAEFVKLAKTEGSGLVEYHWPKPGSEEPVRKFSYIKGFEPWGWVIGTGVYVDDLDAIFYGELLRLSGIVLVILALCGGICMLLVRSITRPINALGVRMRSLRDGDTDTDVPGVERGDEIGDMAQALEAFREAAIEREVLSANQSRAQATEIERQQRIEAMIGDFRVVIAGLLEEAEQTNATFGSAAETLSHSASASAERTTNASTTSQSASENVQSVASAAEELAASISEISRQVGQTTQVVTDATVNAQDANAKVAGLAEAANKIGEVVTLIQAIAEQTNLLALNATIEAARAGEAGKGFAVVAAEVKELATQTSKATEEIGAQIGAIQGSTGEAVEVIGVIARTMEDVNGYTAAIAAAVEQQGSATGEISRNVQHAAEGTRAVAVDLDGLLSTAQQSRESAEDVLEASRKVTQTSHRLKSEFEAFLAKVAAA